MVYMIGAVAGVLLILAVIGFALSGGDRSHAGSGNDDVGAGRNRTVVDGGGGVGADDNSAARTEWELIQDRRPILVPS